MPVVYFVTLSRSDYSSLRPVARVALTDPALNVKIIAGGSHLLKRYGDTFKQIEKDGLPIYAVAEFLSETDINLDELSQAYARAVTAFVKIFSKDKPDYVFVIGDRWEMLAVVSAASMLQLPVVHHSGGDITQGSADNQVRYALTCLSHIHLTALDEHRERLLRMGEESWRVITTGEPALTELKTYAGAVPDIRKLFGLKSEEPFVLATFHPTSFETLSTVQQIDGFLQALDTIKDKIIITAPNADAQSDIFLGKLKNYAGHHNTNVRFYESLGTEQYYAAMAVARYMIGNSSSGMWESSSFGLPVINIGPRQQGRVHGENVINVPLSLLEISSAIKQVSDPAFHKKISGCINPYARSNTLELIINCLKHPWNKADLLAKRFVDPLTLNIPSVVEFCRK